MESSLVNEKRQGELEENLSGFRRSLQGLATGGALLGGATLLGQAAHAQEEEAQVLENEGILEETTLAFGDMTTFDYVEETSHEAATEANLQAETSIQQVEVNGETRQSRTESQSLLESESISHSERLSLEESQSLSTSVSTSLSESISESMSESISESESLSVSTSESTSMSLSESSSMSESLANIKDGFETSIEEGTFNGETSESSLSKAATSEAGVQDEQVETQGFKITFEVGAEGSIHQVVTYDDGTSIRSLLETSPDQFVHNQYQFLINGKIVNLNLNEYNNLLELNNTHHDKNRESLSGLTGIYDAVNNVLTWTLEKNPPQVSQDETVSPFRLARSAQLSASNQLLKNSEVTTEVTVSSWDEFGAALNNSLISLINLSSNLTGTSNLNYAGHKVTVKGNGHRIDFNQYVINATALDLTFDTVEISSTNLAGAIATKGSGDLRYKDTHVTGTMFDGTSSGDVTITIEGDVSNEVTSTVQANINEASKVVTTDGSSLTLTRTTDGDGIRVKANGSVQVGNFGKLNITLKDGEATDLVSTQKASNVENYNTAIRAGKPNQRLAGSLVTGQYSEVTLKTGHGIGLVLGQQVNNGGVNTNLEGTKGNTGQNTISIGENAKFNFVGRAGVYMGNQAEFTANEGSQVTFRNYGSGSAVDMGSDASFTVKSQAVVDFQSDGKNSGSYSYGNYIGLNDRSSLRVEKNGTLRVKLSNHTKVYDDVINLNASAKGWTELYVGENGTLDLQTDNPDYYAELISIPLGGADGKFTFDNVKYVNLEKTNPNIGHKNSDSPRRSSGSLVYFSGEGLFEGNGNYRISKWQNESNTQGRPLNVWHGVTEFSLAYDKFRPERTRPTQPIDITGSPDLLSISGEGAGTQSGARFDSPYSGFNPAESQRITIESVERTGEEEENKTSLQNFNIIYRYNPNLATDTARIAQQGRDTLVNTKTTTYYIYTTDQAGNVVKTIDTSKGNNGVETRVTTVVEGQDLIIEYGPQTATVNYYDVSNGGRVHLKTDTFTGETGTLIPTDPTQVVGTNWPDYTIKRDEFSSSNKTFVQGEYDFSSLIEMNTITTTDGQEYRVSKEVGTEIKRATNSTDDYQNYDVEIEKNLNSDSSSESESNSLSQSLSESESNSHSQSLSESESNSLSQFLSESESTSYSQSISLSESISASVSESISESVSESISESVSESISESVSESISESVSESISESVSESISEYRSMSMSSSMSQKPSQSESQSADRLPNTGELDSPTGLLGVGLLGLAALIGKRRKKEDEMSNLES